MKVLTRFQEALLKEYNRTRKQLRTRLKRPMAPADVKAVIKESFTELTERQTVIIARYIYKAYKGGLADARKEHKGIKIEAAAPIPDMGSVGMDLCEVSQLQMNRIFHTHLGAIGKYNMNLSKTLQHQYNKLLSDNKLIASLNRDGWTPWLDETLKKRGTDHAIINLIKGQKTSKQMINILELYGIKGGMHPNQVAKRLIPHITRFFGPEGVVIDNVGKEVKRLNVDADGIFEWKKQTVTKIYKATPRTYSRLIARNTLRQSRMDAYYESLSKSKLVDHYISVAHMDSNTCAHCAMMHGQTVTKGTGPQYHGNCGCDLRPVWKKNSPLASQNKPDAFYKKQRNLHFMRAKDLKNYNAKMPRGMKLKYATQLPEDAITKDIPDKAAMRKIRHEMLGKPAAIKPSMLVTKPKVLSTKESLAQLKREERATANELWAETSKDGLEHAKIVNDGIRHIRGDPKNDFIMHHTHPTWDSPLSGTDLGTFLETKQFKKNVASSPKRIYIAIKKKDTIIPKMSGKRIADKINELAQKINTENTEVKMLKTFTMPTKEEAVIIWHDAMEQANKIIAEKYNFDYISFSRK
jgi:hypothetical protein